MKKKTRKIIIRCFVAAVCLCAALALYYFVTFYMPNSVKGGRDIYVYHTTDYSTLIDSLAAGGSVKNMKSLERAANLMHLKDGFKPGHYQLQGGLCNKQIVRVFSHGWQTPVNLVVKGYVRNLETMAGYLSKRLEADSTEIMAALNDEQIMKAHGFRKETYISMFIPNTYEVYWTITPLQFLDRMKKEYDAFWNDDRTAKAKEAGLSRDDVMTLASIVIEETKYEPEMPTVAGVYINRLHKGMPLQADPTVKFALNDPGIKRILNQHLAVDSPYNTYKHTGLPPGPITIAPAKAVDAVLNYKKHNYLYFCAKETFDGQHNFAATYSEHMENARRYHSALNARKK